MKFPSLTPSQKFSEIELSILDFWKKNDVFQKTVDSRPADNEYVFFDGPPFATGTPHYGHILAGAIKDAIPRYMTMKGFRVNRKWGWDCHGVPVEFDVEKRFNIGGKPGIEKMGVANFNETCRSIVLEYTDAWEKTVERMGRFVDFKNDYKTMDPDFMESVWSVFTELWNKGLIYEGEKVVAYSPKLGSPLSNFEANLNYKQIKDKTLTVKFELEKAADDDMPEKIYILAWTTTPWTLPSNLALCVNPSIEYSTVAHNEDFYIVASSLVEKLFGENADIVSKIMGKNLINTKYKPLFSYFTDHQNAFQILGDEFVSDSDGTGIVHLAPNFGEEDARICQKNGIAFLEQPIDENGYFTDKTPELYEKYFRPDETVEGSKENNANDTVIKILKEQGKIFKQDQYDHEYPFCWRTECALMYRGIKTWFVDIQKIKNLMLEQNQEINWNPDHLKDGRFGKILENAPDWAISRNRYWGAPIPVWRCAACGHTEVVSTREELHAKTGKEVNDLHKHFVDELVWDCPKCAFDSAQAPKMQRIPEVLDCWFESGAMPYASRNIHFQKNEIPNKMQADFIAEGLDQTRGWFYTLHVLGCALTGKNIFKNVITNGIVLAEDGQKMSKSKKNYPDPSLIFDKYGADAMRFYMLASPVVRAENFRFAEKGVEEVLKTILIPLQNVYSFFSMYANIDNFQAIQNSKFRIQDIKTDLDKWILGEYEKMRAEFTEKFENYKLDEALRPIPEFIDSLTNWYIRRSRDRFWESGMSDEKRSGYETLYFVLKNFAKILAPIMPFYSEFLWRNLTQGVINHSPTEINSVHLQNLAESATEFLDENISAKTKLIREIITLSASIRARKKLKRRQPLSKLSFALSGKTDFLAEDILLIKEEANVKEIEILKNLEGLAKQIIKADARIIGKKFGKKTQEIINAGKAGNFSLLENGQILVADEILEAGEYEMAFECAEGLEGEGNQNAVVLLDTEISEELFLEGIAREIIRTIQEGRKTAQFNISDRISVQWFSDSENICKAYEKFGEMIDAETLTIKRELVNFIEMHDNMCLQETEMEGEKFSFVLSVYH